MPNIQQPEMRRSGKDPLVQDSAKNKADATPGATGGHAGPVPPDQRSPYGPQPPRERRKNGEESDDATREAQEAHGGSMAPELVDDTGHPLAEPPPAGGA